MTFTFRSIAWLLSAFLGPLASAAVWPQPLLYQAGNEVLWLDKGAIVTFSCGGNQIFTTSLTQTRHIRKYLTRQDSALTEQCVLEEAVRETLRTIQTSGFVPWKFHKRRSNFEPDATTPRQLITTLKILQHNGPISSDLSPLTFFKADESYQIDLQNGTAVISTNFTIGTLRALETLKQLFYSHSTGAGSYTPLAPLQIFDQPKWAHRGLSLDIARNAFMPGDAIKTIDAMATAKLNYLHIHATDSQSWPIEIPSLPDLASKGAYQPSLVWSVTDLENVQSYGVRRGVSVFIEIDMPGHTASVAQGYPDLITAFDELDWSTFAAEPLSGQLKLNSSAVKSFVDTVLNDLLPRVKPYTSIYHAGGDEVNAQAYLLDETVQSNDSAVLQPLLQNLFNQIIGHVLDNGLQPVVWEEMIIDWNLTLPSATTNPAGNTLVQVWRSSENIEKVLKKGYRVLFGDYEYWYLDCGFGQFLNPYPSGVSPPSVPYNSSGGRPTELAPPYLDYCNPLHNWRAIYMYNPLANVSADVQNGIEGGEVLIWSEQTDPVDLDFKLWPRAASAAEVLWAGPRNASMIEDASMRLGEWRERAVIDHGVSSSPVQMTWCLMEGGCQL